MSDHSSSKTTSFLAPTNSTRTRTTATSSSATSKTFTGIGNLIKLLPTGTVFLFSFLSPVVTNSGHCGVLNKALDVVLVALCGLFCVFASFTDSYTDPTTGAVHYVLATADGIWPPPSPDSGVDLSKYRLRAGDFVHAFFSATVFAVLSLLDSNTVRCFYPGFESEQKVLLQVLPPVIGTIAATLFVVFPNNRHGIGQPPSNNGGGSSGDSASVSYHSS